MAFYLQIENEMIIFIFAFISDAFLYHFCSIVPYNLQSGRSAARLARIVRDDEAESSNLSAPTEKRSEIFIKREQAFFIEAEL